MDNDNRQIWPCVNANHAQHPCEAVLGYIVNGELSINLDAVIAVNTTGANVTLTCAECGRPKIWYAKKTAVADAYMNYLGREAAKEIQRATGRI